MKHKIGSFAQGPNFCKGGRYEISQRFLPVLFSCSMLCHDSVFFFDPFSFCSKFSFRKISAICFKN